jgi:hypothetical protein
VVFQSPLLLRYESSFIGKPQEDQKHVISNRYRTVLLNEALKVWLQTESIWPPLSC